jgi:hypothetical protein
MGSYQTLKSVLESRVRPDISEKLASQRFDQGEGLMCPAGAGDISFDIYGRPSSQNTLFLNDAACSHYTDWSASRRIGVENNERPYIPVCGAGSRGGGDTLGVGRDAQQQNLYGQGYQGNMVKHYPTGNNTPWEEGPQHPSPSSYIGKMVQPFDFSHDSTSHLWRG